MTMTVPPLGSQNWYVNNTAIGQLAQGRSNATGTVTLTASVTKTTVNAPFCSNNSYVWLTALTSDAANDGATTWTSAVQGGFTVHHANNTRTDRTFGWIVLG